MSTRLSLALLLVAFAGCIDGSTPVNVGATRGDPDATHSTVEVVPATGVAADGVAVALVKVTVRDRNDRVLPGVAVSFTATGAENTLVQPPVTATTGMTQGSIASTRAETKALTVTVGSGSKKVELAQHPDVTFVPGDAARLEFVTQPPGSVRAGDTFAPAVQLQLKDAQGNVVTTPANVTLTLEPASSGATLGGTATRATSSGSVSFDDLKVTLAGTGYTLTASGPGLISAVSTPFDITAGAADPSKTLVEVSKSTVVADGTDSTVITVTVRDAFDNPVSGQTVSISSSGTDNTLTQASNTSAANGTVTATLRSTTAETKTIQATVNTVVAPPKPQVTFVPGSAEQLAFVVHPPAQTVAGQTMAPAVQVQVLDGQGNRVTSANVNVTLELEPVNSGATLGGTITKPLVAGLVSFGDLSVQKVGVGYVLRATGPGLTAATSNSFTIVPGPVDLSRTLVQVSKTTVTADGADFTTITVTSRDSFDNPVSGQSVGLAVSGSNNTLSAASGTTGTNGTFSATLKSTKAEVKTISATLNSSSVSTQPQVTFVSGGSSGLSFVVHPPAQTAAGQTMAPPIQLEALDSQGNRVTSANFDVTLVVEPVASGATLGGTTTRTMSAGLVSFNDLNVQKAGTGYTLLATASGVTSVVSNPFDIVAGPVDVTRTLVQVSKNTVTADGTDLTTITVTARDAFDNPVSGQAVGLAVSGSSNTLSAASGTTGTNGTFSATLKSTKAEVKTISATLNGNSVSTQPQVTFVSGTVSRLSFVVQPPAQTVAGQTMTPAIQVEALDAQGNRVTSASINVALTLEPVASGATLGGTTTKILTSGLASFSDLSVQKAGTGYTLRAASPGVTDGVSTPFDIIAGPVDISRTLVQVSKNTVTADGTDFTTITVTSRDSFDNPLPGQNVGLTVSGSSNTLSAASGTTAADGTFSATLKSTKAEVKTISATLNGTAVSTQPQVTFVPGPASRLSFVVQPPAQTGAGQTMAPAIQVEALDAQGNRVTASSLSVALALEPVASGATLNGTTTKALSAGLVSFNDLNVQKVGTGYTLRASTSGLTDAVSTPFDITAGAVDLTKTLVEVSKATVTADGTDFTTITVTSRDSFNNPVSGQSVGLTVSGSSNTLSTASGTTGAGGTFSATLKSTKAEVKTISATLNGTPVSTQPQVTFVPGPASRLSFVVQPPAQTVAGQTMTPPIQVEALDAQGNRATSTLSVALTLEPVASGATLNGTTTKALSAGLVGFSDLNVRKAGIGYTLRASASGLTDAVSTPFDIVAGPVDLSRTLVEVSKTSVIADNTDFTTITVTARDAFDNPVSGQAVAFSVTGSGNTLSPTGGNTGAGGTFSATLKSTKAEIKTISATLNSTLLSTQPQVTFIPGPPVALAFVTQPPTQTVAGQTMAPPVQVEALDAQGNRVSTASVNVTLVLEPVASGATLGGTTMQPTGSGVASFGNLSVQKAGTGYTLRATAPGLTAAVSNAFNIVADAPSPPQTTITLSKSTVAADGLDFTTITVTVRDIFGNPVSGQAVNLSVSGSDNTLSSTGGTTAADGTVSATLSSITAEIKTITVLLNGNPLTTQPQVTFIPGPGVSLRFVSEPPATVGAGQTIAPSVQVEVLDVRGNRVTGSTATISLLVEPVSSGATLGGTPARAVSAGLATFNDLFVQQAGTVYQLRASASGLTDALSLPFSVTAGPPASTTSTLTVTPASVVADNVAEATITVSVKDAYGNPVANQNVSLSVSGVNNTLTASSGLSGSDGRFVARLRSTTAEVKNVNATAASLTLPTATVTFVPGPVATLTLTAAPTQVEANGTDASTLTATAEDVLGNRVPGVNIVFTSTGTNNTFVPGDGPTDANGQRVTAMTSTATGTKTVTATGATKVGIATITFLRPPAQVTNPVLLTSPVAGCAAIQYTLTQSSSARADVTVEYEVNGVFKRATQAGSPTGTGSGVQGVATSPTGVTHTFIWNSTADLPTSTETLRVRITALVQGALASSAILNGVVMANGLQFAAPGLSPAGTAPGRVARGDLNNDGKTDLVVGSSTSNDLQVLLGDGAGSFGAPTVATVGFPSSALVLRDVDGDGKLDVLTGAPNSNVYLLKGTGTGTFGAATVATTLQATAASLVVGDFNRDGKLDLIATSTAGTVEVALATAAGVFAAPARTNVGGSPQAIATSDLNLDGRLDLVFVDPTQDLRVMLGTGVGTFGAVTSAGVGVGAVALAVTDLNHDARPDLVAALSGTGTVSVASGNGDGTFALQPSISLGGQPAGLAVADLDEDGNRDVLVTGVGNNVLILTGKSDGTLSATPRVAPAGGPTTALVVLDADRSGRQDVVAVRPASNGVAVLLSTQADRCEAGLNAGQLLQVGPSPAASTVADLDGDGRPDLVVALGGTTSGASALAIAKGRGNGSFSAFTSVSLGTGVLNPQGVTTGDFNGDGRLDLVSSNVTTNNVSVLIDNGAGGYNTPSTWNTGNSPRGMATADFDADGKVDLVVTNSTTSNVTVLYGNGDGTFPTSFNFNVGSSPQNLAVVDLNGDGKLDIATANFGGSNVTVLRNNGGRSSTAFTSLGNTSLGYTPRAISTGDFNADNKPDIVVVGNPSGVGGVSVMLGNGDGTLGAAATTAANISVPEFRDPRGLAVGDFDQDGKLDVMTGNNTDVSVILLKGLGNGKFTIGSGTATATGIVDMVGADVDGDGLADLVGTITSDNRVFVVRSRAGGLPGTAIFPLQTTSGAVSARGVTVVDMNKDGKLDVLTANRSTAKVSLLLGDGAGGFLLSSTSPTVGAIPGFMAAGDLDRDGNMDAVVTNNNSSTPSISVLMGDGTGGLTKVGADLSYTVAPRAVTLADFNSDGAPDMVAGGSAVYLRLNNGSGSFGAVTTFNVNGSPQSVAVADFNQDGRLDVAAVNASSSVTVAVLLGNGNGTFVTPSKNQALGNLGVSGAAADFDRDGKVDLAVTINGATSGNYDVKVLKGKGDGTFDTAPLATLTFAAGTTTPEWLTATDFDGDGRQDLVAVGPAADAVFIWRGNGAGGFTGPTVWGSTEQAQSMAVVDINGDGLMDVITGGFNRMGVLLGR